MSDKIGSPVWSTHLSTRAVNALWCELRKGGDMANVKPTTLDHLVSEVELEE